MSDPWLNFDPVLPSYLIVALLLIVSVVLFRLEVIQQQRFRRLRIAMQVLIIIALAGLFFRPSYQTERSTSILLLTPGFNPVQADSIIRLYPNVRVMHTSGAGAFKNSNLLHTHQLTETGNDIRFIMGQGLPPGAMDAMGERSYQFLASDDNTPGIKTIHVTEPVFPDRKNIIEGMFYNASGKNTIYLSGPGGKEDSVILSGKGSKPFSLSFTPKQSGTFLYALTVKDSLGKETTEHLPVIVRDKQKLDILFVLHFPTFEVQYLKSFLARDQHQLTLRYQLSKNKYRYEFANRTNHAVDRLTEESLQSFNLLFIDTDALQALTSPEKNALQHAIQSGLGVVVLFNEPPHKIERFSSFAPFSFQQSKTDTAKFRFAGKQQITLPSWPSVITESAGVIPILKTNNRSLSAYTYKGLGKVGIQLLQETYRLSLEGDSSSYNTLWSTLIENTARSTTKKYDVKITSPAPYYTDEPVYLEIISSGGQPTLLHDSIRVPLKESIITDDVWKGKLWTNTPGWHTLLITEDSTQLQFYVSPNGAWKTIRGTNTIQQTALHSSPTPAIAQTKKEWTFISPLIFFIIFLLSAGVLWLSPKLG